MKDQIKAWDAEYIAHGRMWRGPGDIEDIIKYLPEGARVLDLGCGNGKTLKTLREKGFMTVGLDTSREALALAGTRSNLVLADACLLPFKGGFHGVVAYHILDHLTQEDRVGAMAEIVNSLSPGGYIFIKVFSKHDMRAGKTKRGFGIRYHYFDEEEIKDLLGDLQIIELKEQTKKVTYGEKDSLRAWIKAVAKK